jgi:hypothetical protein
VERLERLATLTLGCYLAGSGIRAFAAGHSVYTNLLGRPTPSSGAILLGILLLGLGILWPRLTERRR